MLEARMNITFSTGKNIELTHAEFEELKAYYYKNWTQVPNYYPISYPYYVPYYKPYTVTYIKSE